MSVPTSTMRVFQYMIKHRFQLVFKHGFTKWISRRITTISAKLWALPPLRSDLVGGGRLRLLRLFVATRSTNARASWMRDKAKVLKAGVSAADG